MRFTPSIAGALIPFALAACGDTTPTQMQDSPTAPQLSASADKKQGRSPKITITELGVTGWARAINSRGDIVGSFTVSPGVSHAYLWRNGVLTDLGAEGESFSFANDINNRGQVVGFIDRRAVLWENGTTVDLGTLGGPFSEAVAINDRGQILVEGQDANGETRLGVWEDGVITELPLPRPIAFDTRGGDINNRGQVVGHKHDQFTSSSTAVMWDRGELIEIGNFSTTFIAIANGVNNRGQVVGESDTGVAVRPFFWDGGAMVELATLGDERAFAAGKAINDRGQIVGWSDNPTNSTSEAVLWWNGGLYPLGLLEGRNTTAVDINNRGQVLGNGRTSSGDFTALIWTIR